MQRNEELAKLAAEAFVYGFPIVFNLETVQRCIDSGFGAVPAAPLNAFGHADELAGADAKFVSVNNDTIYSIAQVDVTNGPVRLSVPDTNGRYYVLQFVDAWTNNFAYIGTRSTGTAAGTFLLVGPAWDGEAAADEQIIHFPTNIASIVGRVAVDGEEDLPTARAVQAGLRLEGPGDAPGVPVAAAGVGDELKFFEQLRVAMSAFPPAERDLALQQSFAPLGLLDADSPYVAPEPELATALAAGLAAGQAKLEAALDSAGGAKQNGWQLTYEAFNYNLDFFGPGVIDAERWKIADPELRIATRAMAARAGLWGNHGYEAAYAVTYIDAAGEPLSGERSYELRFEEDPPCDAFWSITMYGVPEFYLVDNPINRYSVGDRTRGLQRGDDGSLTIHIQHQPPDDAAALANWLPAPAGNFRPMLRVYQPASAVFDGTWEIPAVVAVGDGSS